MIIKRERRASGVLPWLLLASCFGWILGPPLAAQRPRPGSPGQGKEPPAQPLCQTASVVLNTGFDEDGGNVLGVGSGDNSWKVVDDGNPATFEPRPSSVIQKNADWDDPQVDSQWISAYPDADEQESNQYVFENCFCLLDGYKNPRLELFVRADDWAKVFLNDVSLGKTGEKSWKSYLDPHHFVAQDLQMNDPMFKKGRNCVRIELQNTHAVAMGLNVAGTVKTNGRGLSRAACCDPKGSISGQKWHDLNGDGLRQAGEPVLEGWKIMISDGQKVVSVTTDSKGYYSVDLKPGAYTVTEDLPAGWQQTFPQAGSHAVQLGTGDAVTGRDFGNRRIDFSIELTPSNDEDCDRYSGNNGRVKIEIHGQGTAPFTCCGAGYPEPSTTSPCPAGGGTADAPCCGPAQGSSCTFIGVTAGGHTYQVTDANGVAAVKTTKVDGAVEVDVQKQNATFPSCNDGSISVKGIGDFPPFEYRWDHAAGDTPKVGDLKPGGYRVIVTDDRGGLNCFAVTEIGLTCEHPKHDPDGWTKWLNRDGPGGSGDYETLADHLKSGQTCPEPDGIECQSLAGVDWRETGQVYTCEQSKGGVCLNADQKDGRCLDYRVRFLCGSRLD